MQLRPVDAVASRGCISVRACRVRMRRRRSRPLRARVSAGRKCIRQRLPLTESCSPSMRRHPTDAFASVHAPGMHGRRRMHGRNSFPGRRKISACRGLRRISIFLPDSQNETQRGCPPHFSLISLPMRFKRIPPTAALGAVGGWRRVWGRGQMRHIIGDVHAHRRMRIKNMRMHIEKCVHAHIDQCACRSSGCACVQ
jgi:hypothetical protein